MGAGPGAGESAMAALEAIMRRAWAGEGEGGFAADAGEARRSRPVEAADAAVGTAETMAAWRRLQGSDLSGAAIRVAWVRSAGTGAQRVTLTLGLRADGRKQVLGVWPGGAGEQRCSRGLAADLPGQGPGRGLRLAGRDRGRAGAGSGAAGAVATPGAGGAQPGTGGRGSGRAPAGGDARQRVGRAAPSLGGTHRARGARRAGDPGRIVAAGAPGRGESVGGGSGGHHRAPGARSAWRRSPAAAEHRAGELPAGALLGRSP